MYCLNKVTHFYIIIIIIIIILGPKQSVGSSALVSKIRESAMLFLLIVGNQNVHSGLVT
jgi:hypothetical protein